VLLLHVARRAEKKNAYWILVGKSERKRLLGKLRRICEDDIKKNLKEYGEKGVDWIDLAQDINR
jgi:hypothetical protein